MNRDSLLLLMCVILVLVAASFAVPSFWSRHSNAHGLLIALGDPLAAGVFLGAGLLHMLPDAARGYSSLGIIYPWPYLVCGGTALALTILEQLGSRERKTVSPPLLAATMLTLHSLLAGAALGATRGELALVTLFLALIAHKGAASFSLSRLLAGSALSTRACIAVQGVFVLALPIGVVVGGATLHQQPWPFAAPTMLALGAGTFIYFGTIHRRIARNAGPVALLVPVFGFSIMAVVAAIG